MEKPAFAALLGKTTSELGSIEGYLHAVATEPQLPDLAIAMCVARIEEAAPALRRVVSRAADGQALSDDEEILLFRGLHILGGARDAGACAPLLRLLRRPEPQLDYLLGDAITETLPKILCGVFDGDVDALFATTASRSVDGFVREALLGAASFLCWSGRIPADRMQGFLERFYTERLAGDADPAWTGWLNAIAWLGLRHLAPLVHRAWDEGRVDSHMLERGDFEDDLAEAEFAPDDAARFKRAGLGYIEDVLAALEWTQALADDGEESEEMPAPWLLPGAVPTVNPWRQVGRNDPCPCGSGKKAKKCCLGS